MGHWAGIKYTFKLNQEDSSYQDIMKDIEKEIAQKYIDERKDPGESFGASIIIKRNKVIYASSSYKSRVGNDLSSKLLQKIESNIKTNPGQYYYFQEDNGENDGAIGRLYGYAVKVGQYLADAGYGESYGFNDNVRFYNDEGIDRFHECIDNKEELSVVIKEGEKKRLLREILGNNREFGIYLFYKKTTPEIKNDQINEDLLCYWLVYGTEDKYKVEINYAGYEYMNIKEYLYAVNFSPYHNKLGNKHLKDLTSCGVQFQEGLHSIDAKFKVGVRYAHSGQDVTKELIESWYQENKQPIKEVPKISKQYAYYLKENYPETFLKLKAKLIQLHNSMQDTNIILRKSSKKV